METTSFIHSAKIMTILKDVRLKYQMATFMKATSQDFGTAWYSYKIPSIYPEAFDLMATDYTLNQNGLNQTTILVLCFFSQIQGPGAKWCYENFAVNNAQSNFLLVHHDMRKRFWVSMLSQRFRSKYTDVVLL